MLQDSWYFSQNDNKGVLEAFDKAIVLKPNSAVAWRGRGIALVKIGELTEALVAFKVSINLKTYFVPLSLTTYSHKSSEIFVYYLKEGFVVDISIQGSLPCD